MNPGGVFGRNQSKEQMRRLAVDGVEVDAGVRNTEGRQQLSELGKLCVGNRDPFANAGRAQLLALAQGVRQPLLAERRIGGCHCSALLLENFLFAMSRQLRDHSMRLEKLCDLHGNAGALTPALGRWQRERLARSALVRLLPRRSLD